MAGAIQCDMCQAEPASVMQSNLANGETVAVGDGCVVPFYLTVLAAILEDMPAGVREELGTQLKTVIERLGPASQPAPAAPAAGGRKRAARQAKQYPAAPAEPGRPEAEHKPDGSQQPAADSEAGDERQ